MSGHIERTPLISANDNAKGAGLGKADYGSAEAARENVPKSRLVYLSAAQPVLYVVVVLGVVLATYLYDLRFEGIFSCQANGYGSDRYLAYCQATHYGDYEHGAFWFGLEPSEDLLASAEVLFLGDSRLQFAFSTAATSEWFSAAATRYFLMGFLYIEDSYFAEALLSKFKPRAKVYVINANPFFATYMTEPARTVMHDAIREHPIRDKAAVATRASVDLPKTACGLRKSLCDLSLARDGNVLG